MASSRSGKTSGISPVLVLHKGLQDCTRGQVAPIVDGFTGDQRFFIGFAQIFRNKMREDSRQVQLLSDPQHSPPEFRTNGTVSNLDAFYKAFGVGPGDKMYQAPAQRVTIW